MMLGIRTSSVLSTSRQSSWQAPHRGRKEASLGTSSSHLSAGTGSSSANQSVSPPGHEVWQQLLGAYLAHAHRSLPVQPPQGAGNLEASHCSCLHSCSTPQGAKTLALSLAPPGSASSLIFLIVFSEEEWVRDVFSGLHLPVHFLLAKQLTMSQAYSLTLFQGYSSHYPWSDQSNGRCGTCQYLKSSRIAVAAH